MAIIEIEIISDIVCLWCFIGKRTVEKAIQLYQRTYPGGKNDTFLMKWRPYYLDLNPPAQSVDKSEVSKAKFRDVSAEKMAAMSNRVNQIAQANAIKFKFGGKIGSTRDAHRLIHFSQLTASPAVQDAVVEKLFEAFHENETDISDTEVLKHIAVDAGLDEVEVGGYLASDQGKGEMDGEAQKNRQYVTTGVPTFIIQKEYRVDGAQDLQEFFEAFIKVKEDEGLGDQTS